MASNPFDNLDLTSLYVSSGVAPPKKDEDPSVPIESLPPASIMAQPPEQAGPKPVMNAAPLLHHQQSLRVLGGVGMQAPPSAAAPQAGMMQRPSMAPQQPQQAAQGMWGPAPIVEGYTYGAPAPPAPAAPAPVFPTAAPQAIVPSAAPSNDPFGVAAPAPPPPTDPNAGAVVPAAPAPAFDPLDMFGAGPPGAAAPPAAPTAVVPSVAPDDDPFGLGVTSATPAPAAPPTAAGMLGAAAVDAGAAVAAAPTDDGDFWSGMGFGAPPAAAPAPAVPEPAPAVAPPEQEAPAFAKAAEPTETVKGEDKKDDEDGPVQLDDRGLPVGGEYYECRINTPKLGAMFFHSVELLESIFRETPRKIIDALGDRPIVAFTADGSAAEAAGVAVGHVLMKVNGAAVENPSEASKLIKETPRPLKLEFYDMKIKVLVQEGMHMVKYDTKDVIAPHSTFDWKPKYVVIGGIVGEPSMMHMYYSKADYDRAVIDIQSKRPVSVKVKYFDLRGGKIWRDWRDEDKPFIVPSVRYANKPVSWRYIVIIPRHGMPIKISAKSLEELKPVFDGIRRVIGFRKHENSSPNRSPTHRNQGYSDRSQGYSGRSQGYSDRSQGYSDRSQGYSDRSQGYSGRSQGYPNQSPYRY